MRTTIEFFLNGKRVSLPGSTGARTVLTQIAKDNDIRVCKLYGDSFDDQARGYTPLRREHALDRTPRGYQADAVDAYGWMTQTEFLNGVAFGQLQNGGVIVSIVRAYEARRADASDSKRSSSSGGSQ